MTITNDGATILKLLEVEHPAAKVLCELADLQDKEVGDGTTSVVSQGQQLLPSFKQPPCFRSGSMGVALSSLTYFWLDTCLDCCTN